MSEEERNLPEKMENNIQGPRVLVLEDNKDVPEDFKNKEVAIVRIWTSTANHDKPGEYVGHVSLELIIDEKRGSWSKQTYISVGPDTTNDKLLLKKPFHEYNVKYVENYAKDLESEGRAPECTFVFYSLNVVAMEVATRNLQKNFSLADQRWTIAGPSFSLGDMKKSYWDILPDLFRQCIGSSRKRLQKATQQGNGPDTGNASTKKKVSCVSLAFEILNEGCLSTLLANKAGKKSSSNASDDSSDESRQAVLNREYVRILRAAGYFLEFGLSSFILSPDVFVYLLKAAKRKELIKEKKPPSFKLKFENNILKETHFEVIEEIPSLEEKKKKPYHFMVVLGFIIVTLFAIFINKWAF